MSAQSVVGAQSVGSAAREPTSAQTWEEACFVAACAYARGLATTTLAALEAQLHAQRPTGYAVEGWRGRTVVTRFGEVRVWRRLYRAPDGTSHFLVDEHLAWPPYQVATPAFAALLVDWATDVSFAAAARRVGEATAGVLSRSTVWRLLQQVAQRVVAQEQAAHAAWQTAAALPAPVGERVVPALYVEADGVWVKTQREPAHPAGYELKCASLYEGWDWQGGPTPGHPRDRYRLCEKQVYCHGFARADADAPQPFWELVDLWVARTYDASQIPVVVIGGDGASWLDTGVAHFPQAVRQRDGFHLARDAARGWGTATGATLYEAVRTGDQGTTGELLALLPSRAAQVAPALPAPRAPAALPAPAPAPTPAPAAANAASADSPPTPRTTRWSAAQVARARTAFTGQVGAPDAAVDWRLQVAPDLVPPDARGLGTQEGTNANLLARRMKKKGMAWSARGGRHLAKVREVATNSTDGGSRALTPWCHRPPSQRSPTRRTPGGFAPAGRLPWPQVHCPDSHGPLGDPLAATLHRINTGGRHRNRLS